MKMVDSEIVPIDSIKPNNWNANSMRDSIFEFLKKNIKKEGFLQPIIVNDDGVIVDGEHRWRACKELGESQVEIKRVHISTEDCKAASINFNLTKGTFDVEKLGKILLELDATWGKELLKENLVMEQKQIDAAIRAHQSVEKIPECAPATMGNAKLETTIKRGDLFHLGKHYLMCGDATNQDDVDALTGGAKINILLTDPPYNVGYEYKEHDDNMSDAEYERFVAAYVLNGLDVAPFAIITPGNRNEKYYYKSFDILGMAFWYKGFALTPGTICRAMVTEPILFIGEKPKNKMLDTDHLEYHTDREVGLRDEHSCPKPIGLFKELVTSFTDIGDSVLDVFGGSGTTLITCELTQRTCYMMEIDPSYVQSIIYRFEKQFGVKAEKL